MSDHIGPVPDAVKRPVIYTAKTGIRTENKFTTVKIFYDFLLQRFECCLFILIAWKNINNLRCADDTTLMAESEE